MKIYEFRLIFHWSLFLRVRLTHWGRVMHICVSKLNIIGSDNGLSPGRRQAIIWNYAGILSIPTLGTNFSEIVIEIQIFSLTKMRLKMSPAKRQKLCLGLNVLTRFQHWFRQWLVAVQAISHHLTQWRLIYRRIYASFGLNQFYMTPWLQGHFQNIGRGNWRKVKNRNFYNSASNCHEIIMPLYIFSNLTKTIELVS